MSAVGCHTLLLVGVCLHARWLVPVTAPNADNWGGVLRRLLTAGQFPVVFFIVAFRQVCSYTRH